MSHPGSKRLECNLASSSRPIDLLEWANIALSRIYDSSSGHLLWYPIQDVQPWPYAVQAFYYKAVANYTYQQSNQYHSWPVNGNVQLDCVAIPFEQEGGFYSTYILDFTDYHMWESGVSEVIVLATAIHMTRYLIERGVIGQEQSQGLWRLTNGQWTDPFIVKQDPSSQLLLKAVLRRFGADDL